MKKIFLVLTIVSCALAIQRVTPSIRLPDYVDNLVHNNRLEEVTGLGAEARKISHFKFESSRTEEILDKLSTKIQWIDIASFVAIAQDLKNLVVDEIHSHYIFKAFPEESTFRYTLINLYKTTDGLLGVVFGQDSRRAYGVRMTSTYHDMRISKFGLEYESPSILRQVGTHKAEFHDFNRNQILSALYADRANQLSGLGFDIGAVISGAGNFIKGAADAYTSIATAFKTVNKQEFQQKIDGNGFSYYKSTNKFVRSIGIPMKSLNLIMKKVTDLMDLNKYPAVQAKVITNMEIIALGVSDHTWTMNDLTFDKNKKGSCDSIIFAMNDDYKEQKYHLLLTYVKGSFKLSPDLMIYRNFKSYAGGIYESNKDVVKEVKRGITEAEIKAVHACMVLSGLKILSDELGISIKLPELRTVINNA
jgi:hypothetical protein